MTMDEQPITNARKSFLQNDRMLVCSMLIFYGLCFFGAIAAVFWGLNRREQTISTNATSTAGVIATQQANATGTAIVRATEQANYGFIDRFDKNNNFWLTGPQNNDYWVGKATIKDGTYLWDVINVKKTFIYWSDFYRNQTTKDFD